MYLMLNLLDHLSLLQKNDRNEHNPFVYLSGKDPLRSENIEHPHYFISVIKGVSLLLNFT